MRTRESFIERARDVEEDCRGIVIDRIVVNIDEPFELELAEFVYGRGDEIMLRKDGTQ